MTNANLTILISSATLFAAVAWGLSRVGGVWDQMARAQWARQSEDFRRLGLGTDRLRLWLRIWGGLVIGPFFILWFVLQMFPLALLTALMTYFAPRYVLHHFVRRRQMLIRDQMVGATMGLANAVKAGLSLPQGLSSICREVPEPLVSELRRIEFEYQRGRPLRDAIEEVRQRIDIDAFTLFALAIEVALDRGGNIGEALERISISLQENQRIERKLDADTASGRQIVQILAVFPPFFLGFFYFLDPHAGELLFGTLAGQLVICAVVLLVYAGVAWANKIMKCEL